ncbi:hypothetical protein [Streptomyces sp. NPDC052114]|uniref:hypothetical protein n=1 Tax=unclassified Streptomyces TaxID=2593676 RepID=UPI003420EB2D
METPLNTPPASAVGSQMVSEALGASPQQLGQLHLVDTTEDVTAWLVITAARHLDHVHGQLVDAAQNAASTLSRVAAGKSPINSLGVLQNSATQINILAARRADAIEHLKTVLHAYRQVTTPGDATAHPVHRAGKAPIPPAATSAPPLRASRRQ